MGGLTMKTKVFRIFDWNIKLVNTTKCLSERIKLALFRFCLPFFLEMKKKNPWFLVYTQTVKQSFSKAPFLVT